jgi:hypothetical protein
VTPATAEGPQLESLTRRLAETPADFLAEPRIGAAGTVNVSAVVADTLRDIGGAPLAKGLLAAFQPIDAKRNRNRLSAVLVGCWLLHDPWFVAHPGFADRAYQLLVNGLSELTELVQAPRLIADPDRREELARLSLKALGLRPAGESEAQADDRLTTLSSSERQRVVRAARGAEARARAIREEMARKAAEEAADKATRE